MKSGTQRTVAKTRPNNLYATMPTRLSDKGYTFVQDDPRRMHLGVSLSQHQERLRSSFIATALVIALVETLLLAWPITATAIWTTQAAINWVWFVYLIRVALLIWAVATSTSLAVEKLWGMGTYNWTSFYRVYASFSPSTALIAWSSIAFGAGCVLGGIATIVSAAIYTFYSSKVLYGLSIGLGVVGVIESFVAPFVLYHFGVVIPVNTARALELKRAEQTKYGTAYT